MEFTMQKVIDEYYIMENDRHVFTVSYEKENGLLSIYLKNMFGDEILGLYQVRKWYSRVHSCMNFMIYENDQQIGELKKNKDGFELVYHDVYYRFYCGQHAGDRMVICFDRNHQIAEFTFDEITKIKFCNTTLQGLLSLLCMTMKVFIDQEHFSEKAFQHHYLGVYDDTKLSA